MLKIAEDGGYVSPSVHVCSDDVRRSSGLQQLNDVKKNNHTQNGVNNELKGLKSYIVELNQHLKQAVRQSMKEVIAIEVNTILTKIESLCEIVNDQTQSEPKWTDIVTGRQKRNANSRHENIYRIPVINNRYEFPCSSDVSKTQAEKKIVRKHYGKLTSAKKKKHRILIIGDSCGRECATKIMYNLDRKLREKGGVCIYVQKKSGLLKG
jgi:hypothetical protein